jgi:hypothetical protein
MTTLSIKTQEIEQIGEGSLFPELVEGAEAVIDMHHANIGILEGGIEGGGTSLAVMIKDEETKRAYIVQISGRNFETLVGVYNGFQQRIIDKKSKKN